MPDPNFDFYKLDDRLTDSQRILRQLVRDFVETEVKPHINPYWERAKFPWEIVRKMATLPIWGGTLQGHGCAALDALSVGIARFELAKGDGSIGTFYGVHSGLAMNTIGMLGSEEQKARWLPDMATLTKIGAFGLTEPEHGSDAAGMKTQARLEENDYILNGAKRWIGNASIANLLIIWAYDEAGDLGGFVIEEPQDTVGVTIENIEGKIAKRAILNADIQLENVRVPAANRLENVHSFRDMSAMLGFGRYSIAWESVGIATAVYEIALDYTQNREQFGKPIASFQLIQQKLVEMATEITLMKLACYQLADLMERGLAEMPMLSMAKYNHARKTRYITQLAREILGGNGILLENHVARLMLDAEAVYTYEGTNEVNLLLVGRALTGISAIR